MFLNSFRLLMMSLWLIPATISADGRHEEEPADPSRFAGTWQGVFSAGEIETRLVFHLTLNEDKSWEATVDSPDQGVTGIPVGSVLVESDSIEILVPAVAGSYQGELDGTDSVISGSWRQGGGEFRVELERIAEVERVTRPQDPVRPYPYRDEEVRFPNEEAGITLAGTLTTPHGNGPFPAVVLISGSGPHNRDEEMMNHRPFLVLSDHLTRNGIAVLRFDDRGVPDSEGDLATATSEDFAGDVFAGVRFLLTRDRIDPSLIGLIGHSEGGIIAPMVATNNSEIAFIVLLAGPGVSGYDLLLMQSAAIMRASGATAEQIEQAKQTNSRLYDIVLAERDDQVAAARLSEELANIGLPADQIEPQVRSLVSNWMRFFFTYDPASDLERLEVPVLALNGTLDLQVPAQENLSAIERAVRSGGNVDIQVHALNGLNHLFQHATTGLVQEYAQIEETFAPEALRIISDWIIALAER